MRLRECAARLTGHAARRRAACGIIESGLLRLLDFRNGDGASVPPAELEKVFEPFYRVDGSRSRETGGSGLNRRGERNDARA